MSRKPSETQTEHAQLHNLKMTPGTTPEDYTAQFEMLAGWTSFNDEALEDAYVYLRAPQLHFAEGFCTGHTPQRSGCMEDGRLEPRPSPPRSSGVETFHWPDEPNRQTHKSSDRPATTGHHHHQSVYTCHSQPTDIGFHHSNGCSLAEVMTGDSQMLQLPENWTPCKQMPGTP